MGQWIVEIRAKEKNFGEKGIDHWFGDPSGGEIVVRIRTNRNKRERSEILVECSKL